MGRPLCGVIKIVPKKQKGVFDAIRNTLTLVLPTIYPQLQVFRPVIQSITVFVVYGFAFS